MSDDSSWIGTQVKNKDGRHGRIRSDDIAFFHRTLIIEMDEGGNSAHVQMNARGSDSGEPGWSWLCPNYIHGPAWLPLGDHSGCTTEIIGASPLAD